MIKKLFNFLKISRLRDPVLAGKNDRGFTPHFLKGLSRSKKRVQNSIKESGGFTLLEILVYIAILSLVLFLICSFIFWMNSSNTKTKAKREALENTRRALEIITYEIKGAKNIYAPTTTSNQLSLETYRYLPDDEDNSFIDFFLCGSRICLKKESQDPIFLTSDAVEVEQLEFRQISTNGSPSIKISLTVNYENYSLINLTSTVSLRSY